MDYYKKLFIHNIKYLCKYNYEPEITLILKNNKEIFVVAYKDHIDLNNDSNEIIQLEKIEDVFDFFQFEDVVAIEGGIDFEFPVEVQSVVVDNQLWLDGVGPKDVVNKYKKHRKTFSIIGLIYILFMFIYVIITVLNCDTFDIKVIIACSVFAGSLLIMMIFFTLFDIRRSKIIKKYYGSVSKEDRKKAEGLLQRISVFDNNGYDFFSILRCDTSELDLKATLNQIIKGKKIDRSLYEFYKTIENEIRLNSDSNKYNDEEYNNYIFELVELLEPNLCDL